MTGLARWFLLLALTLGAGGCDPQSDVPGDDQKDQFYLLGKARVTDRDFPGAVEYFDKALERNARNPYAHFELAVIYDTQLNDPAAALYHYTRVLKLVRPGDYPADNAAVRIENCKRELAKSVAQLPSMERLRQELDSLTRSNEFLRQQLSWWSSNATARPTPPTPNDGSQDSGGGSGSDNRVEYRPPTNHLRSSGVANWSSPRPTSPRTRLHVIVSGDTPSSIARKYNVKLPALLAANPRLDPRRLRPSQTMVIPSN